MSCRAILTVLLAALGVVVTPAVPHAVRLVFVMDGPPHDVAVFVIRHADVVELCVLGWIAFGSLLGIMASFADKRPHDMSRKVARLAVGWPFYLGRLLSTVARERKADGGGL